MEQTELPLILVLWSYRVILEPYTSPLAGVLLCSFFQFSVQKENREATRPVLLRDRRYCA